MIQPVSYQKGCLYQDHGAWFVRFRLVVRQADGSAKMQRMALMQRVNDSQMSPHASITLSEFAE